MMKIILNILGHFGAILAGVTITITTAVFLYYNDDTFFIFGVIISFFICLVISFFLTILYILMCKFVFKSYLKNLKLALITLVSFIFPVIWIAENMYDDIVMNPDYRLIAILTLPWIIFISIALFKNKNQPDAHDSQKNIEL